MRSFRVPQFQFLQGGTDLAFHNDLLLLALNKKREEIGEHRTEVLSVSWERSMSESLLRATKIETSEGAAL